MSGLLTFMVSGATPILLRKVHLSHLIQETKTAESLQTRLNNDLYARRRFNVRALFFVLCPRQGSPCIHAGCLSVQVGGTIEWRRPR